MKTIKLFTNLTMVIALVAITSCKKDNLQDAILPLDTVAENTTNSAGGTNGTNGNDGTNGTNGSNGDDGADGTDGADGATGPQGPAGADGADGQDGTDGTTGPAGADGANGTNGADGADGSNGTNGADGATGSAGADGADGNANVQVIEIDISDIGGVNQIRQNVSELTSDVVQNDVVLGYVKTFGTYPLPARILNTFFVTAVYVTGQYQLFFYDIDGSTSHNISAGDLDELKIVIIESSSVSGKTSISDFQKMSYEEVMDHFGLEY